MQDSIQLIDIGEELTKLWDAEQGQKKTRASLFTLILYVQKNEQATFYQGLIKSVVSKFPCRVIMILNELNPKDAYLRTSVSSETISEQQAQIFCEMIHIEVGGKLLERVPFIILPHIQPDLPVYLLWTQDPSTESTVLPHLEKLANRIIFDSTSTKNLQSYCRVILSLMQRFHCDIGDLNWSALTGWRTIFIQIFNEPETFLSLTQSNIIRIYYNNCQSCYQKHPEIEAFYLHGWLASRLNWKFQSIEHIEGNTRISYRRAMKEVVFLLIPQSVEQGNSGTIMAIEIESAKNKGNFSIKKHPQNRQVFIQYSEKDFCQLPYSSYLGGSAEGQEILEEIFYPTGGKHYKEMLDLIATIPWRNSRDF